MAACGLSFLPRTGFRVHTALCPITKSSRPVLDPATFSRESSVSPILQIIKGWGMSAALRNRFALVALLGTAVFFGQDINPVRAQAEKQDGKAAIIPLPASSRTKLHLTVYPNNLAMAAEQRKATIPDGRSTLQIGGLPGTLVEDSLLIGTARQSDLVWTSIRTRANGTDAIETLLRDQIGKEVTIRRDDDDLVKGTLLSVTHVALVRTKAGIEQVPVDQIILHELPGDFAFEPSVDAAIATGRPLDHISMAYLMGGIDWNTSYIADYDSTNNTLNLSAIARVNNHSGAEIRDAELRLVAGAPNRVSQAPMPKAARTEMMMTAMADTAAAGPDRQSFENLHVYGPFDGLSMTNGDTVILPLIDRQTLTATRHAVFQGSSNIYGMGQTGQQEFARPDLEITVTNTGGKDQKSPWPAGLVRIFANGPAGETAFLSEDTIALTPVGRDATLRLGKASNLSGTRSVTSFDRKARPNLPDAVNADLEWTIRNTGTRAETVTIRENVPADWTVKKENYPHDRTHPGQISWQIDVPADTEITLRWSVSSTR